MKSLDKIEVGYTENSMKWNLVTFYDDKFLNRQKYIEEYAKSLDIGTLL